MYFRLEALSYKAQEFDLYLDFLAGLCKNIQVKPARFFMLLIRKVMNMRGIDTQVRKDRRRIFKEIANLAYHSENLKDDVEALPYKIVDYDESEYESIYRERAIARE